MSGIQLEIQHGDFTSVSGPSSCGKSTLLSIIGLLKAPSRGRYYLDQQDVSELSNRERARIRNRDITA